MRRPNAWIFATALSVSFSPAQSQELALTAGQLSDACSRTDEAWISFCHGYVQAVYDAVWQTTGTKDVCVPPGATIADVAAEIGSKLLVVSAMPHLVTVNAAEISHVIMLDKYPCRK
jgi:hypothetical protein